MSLDPREIYYGIDGQRFGPLTLQEIEALVAEGKLGPHDHLWDEDVGDWVPARRYPFLFGQIQPIQPPVDEEADFDAPPRDLHAVPETHPAAYRHAPELPLGSPWARLAAMVIDFSMLIAPNLFWNFIVQIRMGERLQPLLDLQGAPMTEPTTEQMALSFEYLSYVAIGGFVIGMLYALLEASPWQATIGKRLMGLIVTNEQGRRIGVGQALLRYVGRISCRLTLGFGYLMILTTERRQGLHDKLASTLVLQR